MGLWVDSNSQPFPRTLMLFPLFCEDSGRNDRSDWPRTFTPPEDNEGFYWGIYASATPFLPPYVSNLGDEILFKGGRFVTAVILHHLKVAYSCHDFKLILLFALNPIWRKTISMANGSFLPRYVYVRVYENAKAKSLKFAISPNNLKRVFRTLILFWSQALIILTPKRRKTLT